MFMKYEGKSTTGYKIALQFEPILVKFYILVEFYIYIIFWKDLIEITVGIFNGNLRDASCPFWIIYVFFQASTINMYFLQDGGRMVLFYFIQIRK